MSPLIELGSSVKEIPASEWGNRVETVPHHCRKSLSSDGFPVSSADGPNMTIKECRLPSGQQIFYRSKSDVEILTRECFEQPAYLRHGLRVEEGDCIFDVGANIGFFLMQLGHYLQNATVYSFEPVPEIFDVLSRNAERHCHLDYRLFNCGLSKSNQSTTFTYFPRNSIASTMYPDRSADYRRNSRRFVLSELGERCRILRLMFRTTPESWWFPLSESIRRYFHAAREVNCQLRRMSDVIDEHDIRQIDLLKVDTEGAEEDVLTGIEPRHWSIIRQAVVEVHHGTSGVERIEGILNNRGFTTISQQLMPHIEHLYLVYARRTGI